MPIIIFCEFASWGNSPRWCSGRSRSTRWRMRSVPSSFSTQFIISAMAGWRRRKFLKGESSRQDSLVLASGRSWNQIFHRDGSLEKVSHWSGWRRVHVAVLVFFGLITNFMLRVNIMYAIEYMYMWVIFRICLASFSKHLQWNHKTNYHHHNPNHHDNNNHHHFVDRGGTAGKETIKSAFFIGYVIMQVLHDAIYDI